MASLDDELMGSQASLDDAAVMAALTQKAGGVPGWPCSLQPNEALCLLPTQAALAAAACCHLLANRRTTCPTRSPRTCLSSRRLAADAPPQFCQRGCVEAACSWRPPMMSCLTRPRCLQEGRRSTILTTAHAAHVFGLRRLQQGPLSTVQDNKDNKDKDQVPHEVAAESRRSGDKDRPHMLHVRLCFCSKACFQLPAAICTPGQAWQCAVSRLQGQRPGGRQSYCGSR